MTTLPPLAAWLHDQERLGRFKSLRQLAKYAHTAPDTVWRLYTGEVTRPTPETLAKLAAYFGVPRDELMALAGYVSAAPVVSPQEQEKMHRSCLIDALLAGKSPEEQLALIPEDIRDDVSLSFRRVPSTPRTYERIIEAFVRDWLSEQATETLERLREQQ